MRVKEKLKTIGWILRGRPKTRYIGMFCGCCGKSLPNYIFYMRDYILPDNLFDRVSLCDECCLEEEI
jgi:hypothetical protein